MLGSPALVVAENLLNVSGAAIDLDHAILQPHRQDDAVIARVVADAVAMGPVAMIGKPAHVPVRIQRVIADPVRIEMVEAVPFPYDLAFTRELDDPVAHDPLISAMLVRFVYRGRPIRDEATMT